ncbi:MAG: hypothetical protein ACRDFB_09180 [Rhabdochlamydiaceae bacterium]
MADEELKNSDPQGQSAHNSQEPADAAQSQEIQDQLPEKFKGKSAGDIAKSYLDLEKKLGEQSDYNQTKAQLTDRTKQIQQWEALGKVIQANPALYYQIESAIKNQTPSQRSQVQPDNKSELELTDVKLATQNQIIGQFEGRFGINDLPTEDRDSLKQRVGRELHSLVDVKRSKPFEQVLAEIPLDQLPLYLEKAYRLATDDDDKERQRMKGMLEARKNNQAAFSNNTSRSIATNQTELTSEEKNVARRLGIGEEKYLKQKQEIAKQYN